MIKYANLTFSKKIYDFFWFLNFFYRAPIHILQNTSVLQNIAGKCCSTLTIRQATGGKQKTSYETE